jgi:transposase
MEGDRIGMSQRERDRLKVMALVLEGRRTQREAAGLLGLSERQIRRIQRKLEARGDMAIVHGLRGRPSNRRIDPAYRDQVLQQYRSELAGFGPTFAAEKLIECGLPVAASTLRQWLLAEGLWQRRRHRDKHRRRRDRRPCRGELVQADGSHHDWLEGRGPRMVLLVMIEDATSRALARFYVAETTEAYMNLLGRYLRRHGRMVAMYVDGDSVFRSEKGHPEDPQPVLTQFGRALQQLGIGLIQAGSPQAKGRVERFNGTAQDRLVKELRLAGVSTLAEANRVLDRKFLPWFNRRCTVPAQSPNDAHRPLDPSMDLPAVLSIHHERTVANDYSIRFQNCIYQLLPPPWPGLRGGRVTVQRRLDGSLHVRFKDHYLTYAVLGPPKPAGALPPGPRSLAQGQTPAACAKKKGSAARAAEPCAVCPACGRSGRTPAEPYPPEGAERLPERRPHRPAPDHPWRKSYKLMTGHF